MAFGLPLASSYFSTITPQGGSQNVHLPSGSGFISLRVSSTDSAWLTTAFCLLLFLVDRNAVGAFVGHGDAGQLNEDLLKDRDSAQRELQKFAPLVRSRLLA